MRKIAIRHLQPGTKLARAIYNGRMLVMPAGLPVTEEQLERLKKSGILEVYIDDPRVADIKIVEPVSEVTRIRAIQVLKNIFEVVRTGRTLDLTGVQEVIKDIVTEVNYNNPKVVNLFPSKSAEDYIYLQALNVTILSVVLAKIAGYSNNVYDIAIGAFLKDLGMAKISAALINKPEVLEAAELEQIKLHPDLGVQLLGSIPGLSAFGKVIINQHHERCDGTGYPLGLTDKTIHNYAKLVAISDTYSALVAERPHRTRMSPHEAVELIMSNAGFEFDHNLVDYFTKCSVPYPVGTMVRLSTGEKGVVVDLGKSIATRPIIRIFYDATGQNVQPCYNINLMDPQHQTKLIAEVLDD